MNFAVATNTENAKILDGIIFPIMVFMMHFQFVRFITAKIALIRKCTKSYFSVFVFMRITTCFTAITAIKRAIFFFEIFSSRFRKSELFSTNLAFSRHGKQLANRFFRAGNRTTSGLPFCKLFWSYHKIVTAYGADFLDSFSLKSVVAKSRAKRVLMFFDFTGFLVKRSFTEMTKDFHIQHDRPQATYYSTNSVNI